LPAVEILIYSLKLKPIAVGIALADSMSLCCKLAIIKDIDSWLTCCCRDFLNRATLLPSSLPLCISSFANKSLSPCLTTKLVISAYLGKSFENWSSLPDLDAEVSKINF